MNLQLFIDLVCTIACLSFLGFDGISTLAEETYEPESPSSAPPWLPCCVSDFCSFCKPTWRPSSSPAWLNLILTRPFSTSLPRGRCVVPQGITGWNILAVGISNTIKAPAATSRVLFVMSRDEVLLLVSGLSARCTPPSKNPYLATIIVGVFSIVVAELSTEGGLSCLVNFGVLILGYVWQSFAPTGTNLGASVGWPWERWPSAS